MNHSVSVDMSSSNSRPDVSAVVVAYRPEPSQLNALVAVLAAQCKWVFLMDNGGVSAAVSNPEYLPANVRQIDMCGNKGLGAALNLGFELAGTSGSKYVITFDQDSSPCADMVARLIQFHENLCAQGDKVAAVGPRFVDSRNGRIVDYPFMRLQAGWPRAVRCTDSSRLIQCDFLITSGCLVSLAAYREIGPFDTGMFVDSTDIEWGFRANFRGFRLYGVCSITMSHELGLGKSTTVLGVGLLSYGPIRRYYYARNTIRLMKLPYVAVVWKLRMFGGLMSRWFLLPFAPESGHGRLNEWRMFSKGIWDGLRGVSGPEVSHD